MALNLVQANRKPCRTCKEVKIESTGFFYYRKESGKFRTQCIPCEQKQKKKQREDNRESINKRQRDKYKNCEVTRKKNKNFQLKNTFGISLEEYNEMFNDQEGCCAICNTHQSELKKSLSVDHNHSTGKVRDLLCMKCNFTLGYAKENINILNNCIDYLKKHKE